MLFDTGVVAGPYWLLHTNIQLLLRHDRVLDSVCMEVVGEPARITSVLDGTHGRSSLHYNGKAIDLGVKYYPYSDVNPNYFSKPERQKIVEKIYVAIGNAVGLGQPEDWDIIDEEDHIHIEYDPK